MKYRTKRLFSYFFYVVLGMALTTTAVWTAAVVYGHDLGRCHVKVDGKLKRVACRCQHPASKLLKGGRLCGECGHILAPARYYTPEKAK